MIADIFLHQVNKLADSLIVGNLIGWDALDAVCSFNHILFV